MNKFDTKEATVTHLTRNKKPSCVDALTSLFERALSDGFVLRDAYWYAEVKHFLNDHDGIANSIGTLDIEETDEVAKQVIVDELMAANDDGLAEDRIDGLIKWYDFFRKHGAPVALAFQMGAEAGQEEWEDTHDADEAEAISRINEIPSEATKDFLLRRFYALRNEGNSVKKSLRKARDDAEEELIEKRQIAAFLSLFSALGGSNN